MHINLVFILNSVLLGVGLAMDAFSVSLVNGLHEPGMKRKRMVLIAGVFGFFQALMPMIGWVCVHTIVERFRAFSRWIPWIALVLLVCIGIGMLRNGIKHIAPKESAAKTGGIALLVQGVATSIDALSVGFTIADYNGSMALLCALLIAAVTFIICSAGLAIGKRFGTRLSNRAEILGGIILIAIGLEIFLKGVL